jgi:hypothetical protein
MDFPVSTDIALTVALLIALTAAFAVLLWVRLSK